ncbi:hypothetical protein GWK47_016162 [Chionoecetes opilio]|uniref:Uncharacterized protein n=1 Tax=Chionoecetes opilio TaxID=41210 RepID=A0A8J5CKC8_CHIOP|nr:hypothetical protein GWK47_016162 [Chionoecetes opilio]
MVKRSHPRGAVVRWGTEPHQPGIQVALDTLRVLLRVSSALPPIRRPRRGGSQCVPRGLLRGNPGRNGSLDTDRPLHGHHAVPYTPPQGSEASPASCTPGRHLAETPYLWTRRSMILSERLGVAAAGARTGHGPLWGQCRFRPDQTPHKPRAPHARPTDPHLNRRQWVRWDSQCTVLEI